MKRRLISVVGALVVSLGGVAVAQLAPAAAIAKSEAILKNMQDGRFADVFREFDPTMATAIPEEKLRGVWETMLAKFGAVKSIDERRSGELKGFSAAELIVTFEKERVVQRVVFDNDGKVAGLAYQPAAMAVLPAAK
jgi:hypothetical protein